MKQVNAKSVITENFCLRLRWVAYFVFFIISIALIILYQDNNILCNIGCSVLASVCVATFIDIADMVKRRQLAKQQQSFLLYEYKLSVNDLVWDLLEQVRYAKLLDVAHKTKLLFTEWLNILFDEKNYSNKKSDNQSFEDIFEWTISFVCRIEKATNYLVSEKAALLIFDIFREEDVAYFKRQSIRCRSIQRYCKKRDVIRLKKEIIRLLSEYSKHYGEDILDKLYSLDNDIIDEQQANCSEALKRADKELPLKSVFKSIWLILRGKVNTGERITTNIFASLLSLLFQTLAVLGWTISIIGIYIGCKQMVLMRWTGFTIVTNLLVLILWAGIILAIILYSILLWGSSKELDKTDDKNFVVSVFSGVVSLAALVVALIALKGQFM